MARLKADIVSCSLAEDFLESNALTILASERSVLNVLGKCEFFIWAFHDKYDEKIAATANEK